MANYLPWYIIYGKCIAVHRFLLLLLTSIYFVLVWLYKYFDLSVTDESYVDETRVWLTKL